MDSISLGAARRIILQAQGLTPDCRFDTAKQGALQAINQLGYVQIDSIAVINRAHHQTLWTRVPGYQANQVEELVAGTGSFLSTGAVERLRICRCRLTVIIGQEWRPTPPVSGTAPGIQLTAI
ncbi:MAG: hypothetical protein ACYC6L_00765 [Anaerolineae bacterium]